MKRLVVLLPILVLMIAGCGSAQPQDEESAVDVVRQFIDAVERGDGQAVLSLYHPDCPTYLNLENNLQLGWLRGLDVGWVPSVVVLESLPDFQLSVQDTHVVSQDERGCVVELAFTYGATDPVLGPRLETVTAELDLVKYQGTWRIWDECANP